MKTIAFFNNKGGVGKTTLAYHLANMLPRLGFPTLAVDLDPQANLTSAFMDEETLEGLWDMSKALPTTILGCIDPILDGTGDVGTPILSEFQEWLSVLAGDLGLSRFEDKLSDSWPRGYNNDRAALRATSAFYRIVQKGGAEAGAQVRALTDEELLASVPKPAALVRYSPHSAELVFVNEVDRQELLGN